MSSSNQQKNTRVSVDFPFDDHRYLKMYCAHKGISIKQYIVDTVMQSMKDEVDDIEDSVFQEKTKKLLKEKNSLWKRLADR